MSELPDLLRKRLGAAYTTTVLERVQELQQELRTRKLYWASQVNQGVITEAELADCIRSAIAEAQAALDDSIGERMSAKLFGPLEKTDDGP